MQISRIKQRFYNNFVSMPIDEQYTALSNLFIKVKINRTPLQFLLFDAKKNVIYFDLPYHQISKNFYMPYCVNNITIKLIKPDRCSNTVMIRENLISVLTIGTQAHYYHEL